MPAEDMGDMVTVELFFQCRHDVVSRSSGFHGPTGMR